MEKSNGIDLMKAFMAVCIVGIHTQVTNILPEKLDWYITHMIFRLGVPFFFVASGYFFGRKLSVHNCIMNRIDDVKNYIIVNGIPFFFWGGVGLVWEMLLGFKRKGIEGSIQAIHNSFFYPFGAMWFVSSCMIAALIIAILYNHKKILYLIAIIGYSFALICNTYYWVIIDTPIQNVVDLYLQYFVSARNGLFVGVMEFGCGVWLYNHHKKIKTFSDKKIYISTIVAYSILLVEVIINFNQCVRDDSSLFLIMPILSMLILETCFRIRIPYSIRLSLKLRTFSKQLFYLHPFFNVYIGYVLFYLTNNGLIQFIYVCTCCILSMIITKKLNNSFLKKILPE